MLRRPPKKVLDKAIEAMQLHLGCRSEMYARVADQEKLYSRAMRRVQGIAKTTGLSAENAWNQIENEARKRGLRCPLPGRDI